jgi:hypothetical protein
VIDWISPFTLWDKTISATDSGYRSDAAGIPALKESQEHGFSRPLLDIFHVP